jgi:hypothetical protein
MARKIKRESARKGVPQIARGEKQRQRQQELFIRAMAKGHAPAKAAKLAGIGRATAYKWRSEDGAFKAVWDEAVEEGLDLLEDRLMRAAITGKADALLMKILCVRRPDKWAESRQVNITHKVEQIPLEEAYKQLERLGLPVPTIETDYEVLDQFKLKEE